MAEIVNLETNKVVFESDDPETIKNEADSIASDWRKHNKNKLIPYAIRGLDSVELETGEVREYTPPEPPPDDTDRLVIDEQKNTVTVYGNAEAPLDHDGEIINV